MKRNRGSALVIVLSVLAILGILISVSLQFTGDALKFAIRSQQKAKGQIALLSAMDYAKSRAEKDSVPFRTDSLRHYPPEPSFTYELSSRQCGVFGVMRIVAQRIEGSRESRDTAFLLPSANIPPALGLIILDPEAHLSLSNNTRIQGDVAIRKGIIQTTSAQHAGTVLDSSKFKFEFTKIDSRPVQHWIETVARLPQTASNATTVIKNIQTSAPSVMRIPGTAVFKGDMTLPGRLIVADRILIKDSVSLQGTVLCAKSIVVDTKGTVDGGFIALDTLSFLAGKPQNTPVFYVHGKAYSGLLQVKDYNGKGSFIFGGNGWSQDDGRTKMIISPGSHISGTVAAMGWVELSGTDIQGTVMIWNLMTQDGPTQYLGSLRNSRITTDTSYAVGFPDIIRTEAGQKLIPLTNKALWDYHD